MCIDIDYRCWRALGDLSTVIFTLGLNQPSSDDDTPFWLSETRKRIMGSAYNADKQLATFLGRPPRLSWRFCNITLPLDISFREVVAEPSVRDMAISRLDADGWSKTKSDSQAIWVRVALLMGPVRESILELSLNQQVEDLPVKIEYGLSLDSMLRLLSSTQGSYCSSLIKSGRISHRSFSDGMIHPKSQTLKKVSTSRCTWTIPSIGFYCIVSSQNA